MRHAGRPQPEPRSAYRRFRDVGLHWRDNDIYGHINNAVHYGWFDSTVNGWLLEEGLLRIGGSAVVGLVVSSGCDYFGEVAFPDRVTCGLRVGHIGSSSVRYELGLFREDEAMSFAAGRFTHAYVRWPQRRPEPLSSEFRSHLEALRPELPVADDRRCVTPGS